MPFSTVIQSYQEDGRMIMKGCVQGTLFTIEKFPPTAGFKPRAARSVGQHLLT